MKSPFTNKEMQVMYKPDTWKIRGEEFPYMRMTYLCEDTQEEFTTTESDQAGYNQAANQYRDKHGLPYTDEIVAIRLKYGLSATKMAAVLGIGVNQYREYEQDVVPSVSNGKLIASIANPNVFLALVQSSKSLLTEKEYAHIVHVAQQQDADRERCHLLQYETQRVFGCVRGIDNGFAPTSLNKLKNVMLYLLSKCGETFITKMNKLLFYADFLSYRERGMAITGLAYRAVDYGPVPTQWSRVYSQFDAIVQLPRMMHDTEGYVLTANETYNLADISEAERSILDRVCAQLGSLNAHALSELSHQEKGWTQKQSGHKVIPFVYAFDIKGI